MTPKVQKPIIFLDTCDCRFDAELLVKSMLWYSDRPMYTKKKVFMYGRYPAVSIGENKLHIHRLLMMYYIKEKFGSDKVVHHIDEVVFNAHIDNLEITTQAKHISGHLKGKKQDPEFARRRTNATSMTRYGHPIHEERES